MKQKNKSNVNVYQVSMGLTTMLSMSVILMVVSDTMPKTSNTQPLISQFLSQINYYCQGLYILIELLVSAAATSVTVLVMRLDRRALEVFSVFNFNIFFWVII